nr:T9SS type A sorting domain-containing protein [Ignavibacteriaceae bacterium]
IVYVTFYGFGSGHIFKSTDSGDTWIDISDNLPDIPSPAVIIDPNNTNHVYVGTDVGVFVSTTGGGNWQHFNDGLPDVIQAMDLNYTTVNNVIRVMTHGNGAYERKFLSQITSDSESEPNNLSGFKLEQNYPNPFNPVTNFEFRISNFGFVIINIYDVLGNEIAVLVNTELPAGTHKVTFDGTGIPSGTYFYRLKAGNYIETKKMVLLK